MSPDPQNTAAPPLEGAGPQRADAWGGGSQPDDTSERISALEQEVENASRSVWINKAIYAFRDDLDTDDTEPGVVATAPCKCCSGGVLTFYPSDATCTNGCTLVDIAGSIGATVDEITDPHLITPEIAEKLAHENRRPEPPPRASGRGPKMRVMRAVDLTDPLRTARAFLGGRKAGNHCTLRYQQGQFYTWNGSVYEALHDDHMRALAYQFLADEKPTRRHIGDFIDALKAAAHVATPAPCWMDGATGPDPLVLLPMQNGLVDLRNRKLIEPTAALFVHNGLAFDYVSDAPAPTAWLDFLSTIWPDDPDSIATLQEFIGLATLTGDTSHQKALLLVGPKRSGKGTILRISAALAGSENVCSPTLASLGSHFGLQSLIGKRLALLSDARVSGKADMALIAESLLRITGEDAVTVPRKHVVDWHGRLPTRFWIASNELPSFVDASSALTSRFILMRMTRSFFGREDQELEARLLCELPSILHWAMDGLDRLRRRGRFLQPKSGAGLAAELDRMASPISAFVQERCTVEAGAMTLIDDLFAAWLAWCRDAGQQHT